MTGRTNANIHDTINGETKQQYIISEENGVVKDDTVFTTYDRLPETMYPDSSHVIVGQYWVKQVYNGGYFKTQKMNLDGSNPITLYQDAMDGFPVNIADGEWFYGIKSSSNRGALWGRSDLETATRFGALTSVVNALDTFEDRVYFSGASNTFEVWERQTTAPYTHTKLTITGIAIVGTVSAVRVDKENRILFIGTGGGKYLYAFQIPVSGNAYTEIDVTALTTAIGTVYCVEKIVGADLVDKYYIGTSSKIRIASRTGVNVFSVVSDSTFETQINNVYCIAKLNDNQIIAVSNSTSSPSKSLIFNADGSVVFKKNLPYFIGTLQYNSANVITTEGGQVFRTNGGFSLSDVLVMKGASNNLLTSQEYAFTYGVAKQNVINGLEGTINEILY